jgi:hypothetical protein
MARPEKGRRHFARLLAGPSFRRQAIVQCLVFCSIGATLLLEGHSLVSFIDPVASLALAGASVVRTAPALARLRRSRRAFRAIA